MGKLSSREWATIVWGIIILFYIITKKTIRISIFNLIKTFFDKHLILLWIVYISYVLGMTFLYSLLPFWKNAFIKDIIIWSLFSGLIYLLNAASREADETYIIKIVKDSFNFFIIFEFILSTFTFSLFSELLIIPIFTIIFTINLIYERDLEYQNLYKLTNYILNIIGFIFIFKTIEVGINEYHQLNILDTLISFLIPIIYLISTLPLIYVISLYSKYQSLFLRMSFKEGENKEINKKRHFKVLKTCNISIKRVIIFTYEFLPSIYKKMSEEEFDNLLNEFKNKN